MKQLNYLAYARKSLEEDEKQRQSVPSQIRLVKEYVKRNQLKLVDIFTEQKSAKKPGRPIFNQLLQLIEAGKADGIIAWHPDRLARNSMDAGRLIYLLDTGALKDMRFTSGYSFTNDPQGKFVLSIAFGQSKYFSDHLSQNTSRGLKEKALSGIFPGQPPRGYLNDRVNRTIIVDKETSGFIAEAFKLYNRGVYTLEDIGTFLFQHGITTSSHRPVKAEDARRMLRNPFYYGYFNWNKELYEGKHQPLVTKKVFDQVQDVLMRRSPHRWHAHAIFRKKHNFAYGRLFKCGECGYSITAERHHRHYLSTDRWVHYDYYRCTKNSLIQKCFQPYVNQHEIMPQLKKLLRSLVIPLDWREKILAAAEAKKKEYLTCLKDRTKEIAEKLTAVDVRIDRLVGLLLDNTVSRPEYLRSKKQLMEQKRTLEESSLGLAKNELDDGFERFKSWIDLVYQADRVSQTANSLELGQWFKEAQLNLTLKDKKIKFSPVNQWAALCAAATVRNWVASSGFEPEFTGWEPVVLDQARRWGLRRII